MPDTSDVSATLQAAERLGQLFDGLRAAGFGDYPAQDRAIEELLLRVAFCCFAEDAGIVEKDQFRHLLERHTHPDGTDTAARLHQLFQTLSQPVARRPPHLPAELATLPHLGEALFGEVLPLPAFTAELRAQLLACTDGPWAHISPSVFSALFRVLPDQYQRQRLGDHCTPEAHVFKVIGPLFLDELRLALAQARHDAARLDSLHARLAALRLFDPNCGHGTFLVVAYRELRLLELELLQARFGSVPAPGPLPQVRLSQCAGMVLNGFLGRLAELALWMVNHQLNQRLAAAFGQPNHRSPLAETVHLVRTYSQDGNWEEGLPAVDYVIGDFRRPSQGTPPGWRLGRPDMYWAYLTGTGSPSRVARYLTYAPDARAAFLQHKDDLQGDFNPKYWQEMQHEQGVIIQFAHRPFASSFYPGGRVNERSVVVGIGRQAKARKRLFAYDTLVSEPRLTLVPHINHYLLAAPDLWFAHRMEPLANVPPLVHSHYMAADHAFLLNDEERRALLASEPAAAPYLHPFVHSISYRTTRPEWHLPLAVALAHGWEKRPGLHELWKEMRRYQRTYPRLEIPELAQPPQLSEDEGQPISNFIVLPPGLRIDNVYLSTILVSGEAVVSGRVELIPEATPYLFGILISAMFSAWVRQLCGLWKYGYRNDGLLTYHNFPFPTAPTPAQVAAVAAGVAAVQAAHGPQPGPQPVYAYWGELLSSARLAAAAQLDAAVDRCFRPEPFATEQERLEFLFVAYQQQAAAKDAVQ